MEGAAMDVEYELAQQLPGHEGQVRCIAVLPTGVIVTGGLDAQVIMWQRAGDSAGFALVKKLGHHSDFIFALGASHETPGAFYSGSKDKTAVRVDAEGNPIMQYVGHEGPVNCIVERGSQLITGSWDGFVKIWDSATGEMRQSIEAGQYAVSVAVLPTGELVCGSQDNSLRVYRGADCTHRVEKAHDQGIRAISVGSTSVVTASNDQTLKMWSLDGCEMGQISGHNGFVYGVVHSQDNQMLISSSDDCTCRCWSLSDLQCKQSIMHASTVWQAGALANDDIVTACGDHFLRVWTRDPARMAAAGEREAQKEMAQSAAMEAAAKGSSSTSIDSVDISEMPGLIGKKNGEIKCFKETDGKVNAYSWNEGARIWDLVGEVMGGQAVKKTYAGDNVFPAGEYDFIFDVDMGPSHPISQLPYNRGGNAMATAEAYCARESISKGNSEQIRKFIQENAGESSSTPTIGAGSAAAPGRSVSLPAVTPNSASIFPMTTALTFKDGKFDALLSKILEFNGLVSEEVQLSQMEVGYLTEAIAKLKTGIKSELRLCEREVISLKFANWPSDRMFPVLDLWRLYLCHPQSGDIFKGSDRGSSFIVQVARFFTSDVNGPAGMCGARCFANLSLSQTSKYALYDKRDFVLKPLEPALASTNKHTRVACVSVLFNMSIVLHESTMQPKPWDPSTAGELARLALGFLASSGADDADAQQRAVCTLGNLLPRDKENGSTIATLCKSAGLPARLKGDLKGKVDDKVAAEVIKLLG